MASHMYSSMLCIGRNISCVFPSMLQSPVLHDGIASLRHIGMYAIGSNLALMMMYCKQLLSGVQEFCVWSVRRQVARLCTHRMSAPTPRNCLRRLSSRQSRSPMSQGSTRRQLSRCVLSC